MESVPCSREVDRLPGIGGIVSAGARSPFLIVEAEREPENRFFALGADATLRMNRVAALMDLGDNGPCGLAL
jgi:hypothetical protein